MSRLNMLDWTCPKKIGDDYFFNFKERLDKKLSPLDAANFTIEYITKKYSPPYTLYVSGGVDSQAMLYAWHKFGIPYSTFSAVYNNGLNKHDLDTLRKFSDLHSIPINYHNFDLISFLENEHDWYANTYLCGSPQITTLMKLADLTKEGTVIMSGNFLRHGSQRYVGLPDRNNWSLYHYGIKSGKSIVPFFFLETGELANAFDLFDPRIMEVHIPGGYTDKVYAYQINGFPVIAQEKKLTGFEEIKNLYDTNPPRKPTVQDKISSLPMQRSRRNFDLLYRNKYEVKFYNYKFFVFR